MPRYATGKYALGISDRSGRAYKLTNMMREWNGLLVGKDEFEPKQPQLDPRHHITDPQAPVSYTHLTLPTIYSV